MKAQFRPGSQALPFRWMSTTWPYLENSAETDASVTLLGSEPTKIFLAPWDCCGTAAYTAGIPGFATTAWYCTCCTGWRLSAVIGSFPNIPWCRAIVTSQAFSLPGNVNCLSVLTLAVWACSAFANVMKAHWRPSSTGFWLTCTSSISPYLENSALNSASVMASGRDPTNTFFAEAAASVYDWLTTAAGGPAYATAGMEPTAG
mmetsp:Transcript_16152/g.47090  ORF Transcript_16152/g.47090 Transcript_16152/m.47090 type:complete len:203 (+) Transcript_16152:463-1071(+)